LNTYVDASVLVRIIQGEPGPLGALTEITALSSQLIKVECLRTIDRARARGATEDAQAARDRAAILELVGAFWLAPITQQILDRAADPFPTALGTLDAIHLATALELRSGYPDLVFATHDTELATAARSVGFDVVGG
jgi:predicted nucleic acid-binding protein